MTLFNNLPTSLSEIIKKSAGEAKLDLKDIQEIRLRIGSGIAIIGDRKKLRIKVNIDEKYLSELLNYFTGYSYYAYENQLRAGYITLPGGHRVGVAGTCTMNGSKIKSLEHITSMNIRQAREIKNISKSIIPHIIYTDKNNQVRLLNTLIISPPKAGKTTVLRDIIRLLSDEGFNAGVIDERLEISGKGGAAFAFDLGKNTDVLTACTKAEGFRLLLRSMSPDFIATDELSTEDFTLLSEAKVFGIPVIATMHGNFEINPAEVNKELQAKILNYFNCVVYLGDRPTPATILEIETHMKFL